ncbi:MAG TPA: hypothetical protein VKU38_03955 [Ktedonobacteraceae bacterium]|nr:hypothetical protein [Ktedonobacteraceae bacterium]
MYTQEENRSTRLAREKDVYRYTTALESGDIDTIAILWHKAEHDAALESMLLETQTFYMNEGMRAKAIDADVAAQVLETVLPAPVAVQEGAVSGNGLHGYRRLQVVRRVSRVGKFVQSLAAVLIVGVILGGFLVLFASRHAGTVDTQGNNAIHWRIVPSKDGPQSFSSLLGIAALSANDVWAVGANADQSPDSYQPFPKGTQGLIEHWNGSQWQIVPSPKIGTQGNLLFAIAPISSTNIWAVGEYANSNNPTMDKTLVEHWNGTQWHIVPSPNPAPNGNQLDAISVVTPNDIWAVGSSFESNNQQHTLIEHWNGSQWRAVPSPNIQPRYNVLASITAISANDIWAVGEADSNKLQTLVEHWNGSQWSIVASPNPGEYGNILGGMAAISANNIWAVGQANYTNQRIQTLVEHWDGKQWSVVPSPTEGKYHDFLFSMTAISANNIWAAGWSATNLSATNWQPVVEHWDGKQWSLVASPHAGISRYIEGMISVPGTNQIWMVGGTLLNKNSEHSLTEIGEF